MMEKLFIPLVLLFFTLVASGAENKDLIELHHTAEAAMGRSDFAAAREAYEKILEKVSPPTSFTRKHRIDWATYVDVVGRLAYAYLALGEYEKAEEVLKNLMERKIPEEFIPTIKLLQSRVHCSKQSPGEAYILMKETAKKHPLTQWKGEDRSLFLSLEYMLNTHYDALLQKAKRYFSCGNYAESKGMYQELLDVIEKGYYPKASSKECLIKKKVICRLAEVNFYLADYEKALSLISPIDHAEDQIDRQMLYLAAMAYQEKHSYEKALDYFDSYLRSGERTELEHYEHALFEVGLAFYRSGQLAHARRYFEMLLQPGLKKDKPVFLGAIYLARIHLKEKHPRHAESILSCAAKGIPSHNPLHYEIAYLRGKAAFDAGEYAAAADFFELSFPTPPVSGEWCHDALFQLGWCYTKLGDDPLKSAQAKERFFSKAETIFRRLLPTKEHERASLAFSKLLLTRSQHFQDKNYLGAMEALLLKESPVFSLEGKLQALLLKAEGNSAYLEREAYYGEATSEVYRGAPTYPEGWYYRGLNHFQEGLLKTDSCERELLFEKAIECFGKAFSLLEKLDKKKAAELLKLEIQANYYKNASLNALHLCDQLLNDFPISMQEKEEILYLRGLVASRLPDENSFAIAKSSLGLLSSLFPDGPYADQSLYLLGTLHFKHQEFDEAKIRFIELEEKYPTSPWAGEGLFWAAEAMEKLGIPVGELRRKVFQKYPDSSHADEAFFRLFPMDAYMEGEKEALCHLKGFSSHFPHSPLQIPSFYLLGIHSPSQDEKIECFEKEKTVATSLIYFRYRALLEMALLYVKHEESSEIEKAFPILQSLLNDFESKEHSLASKLKEKTPYPPLYEESEFALALFYLKKQKTPKAQEVFSKMLHHYASAGIKEAYYLSKVWQEQGSLALQCGDAETALRCFKMAEECGKNCLARDQKLELWISQSESFKMQNALDSAMKMLSQVINEDVVSPLRVKAMLLRAEIYELQGRHELAIKQLEATAKKGGDWALQAKQKLKGNYGLE